MFRSIEDSALSALRVVSPLHTLAVVVIFVTLARYSLQTRVAVFKVRWLHRFLPKLRHLADSCQIVRTTLSAPIASNDGC